MFRLKTHFSRFVAICLLIVLADIICSVLFLQYVRFSVVGDIPRHVDAGFIFFGGVDRAYRDMNTESLRRVNFALRLFQAKRFAYMVGLGGAYPSHRYSGSENMQAYLVQNGVAADLIFTENTSFDTKTNWQEGCRILKQKQWRRVVLVASPLHVFRLKKMIPTCDCGSEIHFAAYDYDTQNPPISYWQLWWWIHYEWSAYLANYLLPEDFYQSVLQKMRK